jgi:predicted ABC-type ATPase
LTERVGFNLSALSPDDIVIDLRAEHPDWSEAELLLTAQGMSDQAVDQAIADRHSIMVETVLSSSKFESRVTTALSNGFEFGFAYVTVRRAELNVERVKDRVENGGHDVPEDRIRARRERSHKAAAWFAARAHVGAVFDNSGYKPVLLAEKPRDAPAWDVIDPEAMNSLGLKFTP